MRPFLRPVSMLRNAAVRGCFALLMLAFASGAASAATSCTNTLALQLGSSMTNLPNGTIGEPYQYVLRAIGGTPPYTYHAGSLPPGITLNTDGTLTGEPSSLPYIAVFVASVRDKHGCTAQQTYRLAIIAPWRPPAPVTPAPPKPVKPPTPQPPSPLSTLPLADTLAAPVSSQATMDTYMLTDAIFKDKDVEDALKKMSADAATAGGMTPADEPDDSGSDSDAPASASSADAAAQQDEDVSIENDAKAQLQRMLQPLIGVEFPGRELFAAALDARLCRFSETLIVAAANKQGKTPPKFSDYGCPPDWAKLAKQTDYMPRDPLPWKQVPQWLMSPDLRTLLIDKSAQAHSLLNPSAPAWNGHGCGCVRQLTSEVYSFYPFWYNQDKPLALDFSLLSRISVFALWFKDTGDLVEPTWNNPTQLDFIREAQQHRTALDFTLYHNDWGFLKTATDDDITRITARLANEAANFIDTPLADPASRSHAWVPGFARVERYGNGLTLFLDQIPAAKDPLRPAFARYLDRQIRALISELRQRNRHYVLNVVLRDEDLTTPDSIWQVDAMSQYLSQAELPDSRKFAAGDSARYRSNTNLTLRYVVLLAEPYERSLRKVLNTIDGDRNLDEEDARLLLHRVIPVVSSGASNETELAEDMAYISDNFGGAGFWAPPPSASSSRMTAASIRTNFLAHIPRAEQLNGWICDYRWPLRMAAWALLVVWLIAFAFYQSSCRIRQIGLPYQLGLLLGAIAFLIVGALLLVGDPTLVQVRQGNALLAILLVALVATIAYHLLKPRVESP